MALQRRAWTALKFLQFTGVLVHEMLHFIVGLVTMARPSSMSLVVTACKRKRPDLQSIRFSTGINCD